MNNHEFIIIKRAERGLPCVAIGPRRELCWACFPELGICQCQFKPKGTGCEVSVGTGSHL